MTTGDEDGLRTEAQQLLLRFIAAVVLHNQAVSARVGLGASDAQLLNLVNLHGSLTAGRLAEMTGLGTGTVTGVVDRLERAGYVRRERDPGDRRKVVVTPVAEGLERLAAHYADHGAHLAEVLGRRSPAELRTLVGFLTELTDSPGGWVSPPPGT